MKPLPLMLIHPGSSDLPLGQVRSLIRAGKQAWVLGSMPRVPTKWVDVPPARMAWHAPTAPRTPLLNPSAAPPNTKADQHLAKPILESGALWADGWPPLWARQRAAVAYRPASR